MVSNIITYAVKDLVDLGIIEKPLDGNHGGIHPKSSDYVEYGIPFIMASDLINGHVDIKGCKFISEEQAKSLRKGFAKEGDVLLSHKATIGRTAVVGKLSTDFIVLTPQITYYRVLDLTRLNPRYLKYYFDSEGFQALFEQWAGGGSTRLYLGITEQMKLPIELPEIKIQNKIVDLVDSFDRKITLNRQINQTLEQMAQALFKSWFVDFEPVVDNALDAGFFEQELEFSDELLRRAEARKAVRECSDFKPLSNDIRQLFPAAFEECVESSVGINGWIPKGWFIAPLDNIANFQNGLALQKFRPDSDEDEYLPVLKIAQLRQGYCDDNERARIDLKESCRVYNGDMIFSWSGTLMTDIWTGGNAALNQHLYKVTSSKYPLSFYFHWTNHHLARFQHIAAAKAVTMGHIKKGDLSDSFCVVPKNQTLAYFDSIAGAYLEQAKNVRLQSNTLVKLRDCLLPKLISGELCLEDIEAKLTSESVV